jgi:hypothetical protein
MIPDLHNFVLALLAPHTPSVRSSAEEDYLYKNININTNINIKKQNIKKQKKIQ